MGGLLATRLRFKKKHVWHVLGFFASPWRDYEACFFKNFNLTCLLLVTMLASLFAQETPTGFGIVPSSRAVTKFRYQLGGPQADAWIELEPLMRE